MGIASGLSPRVGSAPGPSSGTGGRGRLAAQVLAPVAVGAIILAVWQFLVGVVGVSDYLLPSPSNIASEWSDNFAVIWDATMITGGNAFFGLALGSLVAILLAAVGAWARWFDDLLVWVVAGLAVVPIVALAPVLNSMFGADSQFGRRMIAAIAALVPVYLNAQRGLRQTTPIHRDLLATYAASAWQTFRKLTLPTATPYVLTGVRIASSLAVISALVAEYFGGPRGGLGSLIATSAASSAYARAWAYVGASIVLGLVTYAVTVLLEKLAQSRLGGTT